MDAAVRQLSAPRPGSSAGRILAVMLRHLYLLRTSWPRILDLMYWPALQITIWGLMSQFMRTQSGYVAQAVGVLLAAVMLWDVFFRGQLGVAISFLEEMWSRNLGHLFVSPLRPWEWAAALVLMSLVRVVIGVGSAAVLAWLLFGYSILDLGLPLIAFFLALILLGWAIGIAITALVLTNGLGAEGVAWTAAFVLAPISAVYYPVSVLPGWAQAIAWTLPTSHIFEGMRSLMFTHQLDWRQLATALALDAVWLGLGAASFLYGMRAARRRGKLLGVGE